MGVDQKVLYIYIYVYVMAVGDDHTDDDISNPYVCNTKLLENLTPGVKGLYTW